MFSNIASASLIGLTCFSALVSAAPFSFPLGNGFPNPSPAQVTAIEQQAHGSLPNGGPPPTPKDDTFTSLRLIAFNELTEVAFFTELINNITSNVKDYEIHGDKSKAKILAALTAIVAQEELHLLNANGALSHFNEGPITPCKYNFPVNSLDEAIALASTFTDVVLGTLQDVATLLGQDGDFPLIRGVASVIGQEGEQNGFFREYLKKIPSALPFLTASARDFAFSALNQNFVVPGSCDQANFNTIALKVFDTLNIETSSITKNQDVTFSIDISKGVDPAWKSDYSGLTLVYINQQNTPVTEPLGKVTVSKDGKTASFTANFPFDEGTQGALFGNGLTIAAVALTSGTLTNVDGVAAATVFGPGLIEIN